MPDSEVDFSKDDYVGVVYRNRAPTLVDYDDAIADLQAARKAIETGNESSGCAVCGDGGHGVRECHHNPLVIARRYARERNAWRCYHCGYVVTTDEQAREHFGDKETEIALCLKEMIRARI